MVTILTLILLSLSLDGFSQTLQMSDLQSNSNIDKSEIKRNTQEELATKILLVPHQNEFLDDYYQLSNFGLCLGIQVNYVLLVIVSMQPKVKLCKPKESLGKDH